jgi:hypothetical protein
LRRDVEDFPRSAEHAVEHFHGQFSGHCILPEGHYDYNCCLASIHHMPFGTVAALRQALAPGGVLVILRVYRQSALTDYAVGLAAVPINVAARLAVAAWETAKTTRTGHARAQQPVRAPVRPAQMTLGQIRKEAAALLPGCVVRRRLFRRYVLVFRPSTHP